MSAYKEVCPKCNKRDFIIHEDEVCVCLICGCTWFDSLFRNKCQK